MYRLPAILVTIVISLCFSGIAEAKTKRVTTEYIYHLPDNISPDEAKSIAEQRAKAQAIADEFGTIVTQSSSVMIDNNDGVTTTDFLSIGGSELKGEWLENTAPPVFEYLTDGSAMALKVTVRGIIREIEGCKVPFDVKILRNGTTPGDEADRFVSGDEIYMSFNSPSSGYVAVYLIDAENIAYCLLPYQAQSNGYFEAKANKRYVFFHPDYAEGIGKESVDEFILDTSSARERNRILTVFSPNRFFKAADTKTDNSLPRSLPYLDFQKWLSDVKKKDTALSVTEKAIIITCNK